MSSLPSGLSCTRDYARAQGRKPAHDLLRWVNSKGETGTWSETATATSGA